jgi:hypothetical protein
MQKSSGHLVWKARSQLASYLLRAILISIFFLLLTGCNQEGADAEKEQEETDSSDQQTEFFYQQNRFFELYHATPTVLFDENLPFDPRSISVSIELKNNLNEPDVLDDCNVHLSTLDGEFVRLIKGRVEVNGITLKRWDLAKAWSGVSTDYYAQNIPIGDNEIIISLTLPDGAPVILATFEPTPRVDTKGIEWPESVVSNQSLMLSWENIAPLNHLGIAESSIRTSNEIRSGRLESFKIQQKGSIHIHSLIKKIFHHSYKPLPEDARLTYVKPVFSTHVAGKPAEGISVSSAFYYLYIDREIEK